MADSEPEISVSSDTIKTDVMLVGAGIMSATLGSLLRQLQPDWSICAFERLDAAAAESSDPWNNAGTGHSALCELNYTPQNADGSIDITKALSINEQFQVSRQYWSYAIEHGMLSHPSDFINPIPHVSFAHGADGVDYLRKRHAALADHTLFKGIEFIDDNDEFAKRLPLMAAGRDFSDPVALNWFTGGTDVNFGSLTQELLNYVSQAGDVYFGHEVTNLSQESDGSWTAKVRNLRTHQKITVHASFVFVGAGGGALRLLQKSGIPEIKGFGGFPVSGAFFRCTDDDLIAEHHAKVYGRAAVGAPPMSVPHLDTRVINHKPGLLFGPYAGWSPKFLKHGSNFDLIKSVKPGNLIPMTSVAPKEFDLLKYLIGALSESRADKVNALREFYPRAEGSDWELIIAGQRVQVIKKQGKTGTLQFGTEIVTAADGTIGGLLGASPGASTAVPAMLTVLERCFPRHFNGWKGKLTEMIPSFGQSLDSNPDLFSQVWNWTSKVLELDDQHTPSGSLGVASDPAV
ncbi:malate dehydrogenase (quinone) [Gordonia jinhuaensis]|uniref:Probable malate:quinone oxidoreductase n=1 Tax=Gordonia jinhuaensis TaxID=1517702 RepID=A0A916WSX8_9ACTN|nr:malate dehydrogenase (quinone) [Gordonia jinhuaensis]GGB26874.1 putative malate:quinone oxidoreductase [Gordonia jinhuaensis]